VSDLVITSAGARTPLGLTAVQTGFLLRAGFPAVGEAPLANAAGEPISMALVPTLDGRLVGAPRLAALARAPLEEAVAPLRGLKTAVFVAIDEDLPDAGEALSAIGDVASRVLPGAPVVVEPRGETGLVSFLPAALRILSLREADAVVIGGVHSDHDPRIIEALEARGALFSRENLDSRIPGEAAAFVVLMRAVEAAGKKLPCPARVAGHAAARAQSVPTGPQAAPNPGALRSPVLQKPARPEPGRGEGEGEASAMAAEALSAAVRDATAPLRESGEKAGWLWTDLTTEARKIQEWQSVFVRAHDVLGRPYVVDSPAQRMGYLGAATLPLFAAAAATAWSRGYAPSTIALGIAGAPSGERAALLLRRGDP
jgi:3-oxoacyl-[acyl-carrier-protein] synthase-1